MQVLNWSDLDASAREAALSRPAAMLDSAMTDSVIAIMDAVKARGDAAIAEFTAKFDGVMVDDMRVTQAALKAAWAALPDADKDAMQIAKANIKAFHTLQMPKVIELETMPGVLCRREPRALDSAGLYVPGGTAPLVSTMMMLALPAKIAGVTQRVVVTPPAKDGSINHYVLAAAYLCDVTDVFTVGGAQAIAALAYGTETIPKVAKIFGPGNAYVAIAKSLAAQEAGGPAIDLPAGPSEAMVIADDAANPIFVASDLLSQAEHDTLAQVVCVCRSQGYATRLLEDIERQLSDLPRADIARESLKAGRIIIVNSEADMLDVANDYAPEHLIIQTENAANLVPYIRNAGSVFVGAWTPESVGDYASGTNHTLPTYGAARAYSGVVLESFMKYMSVQQLSREGLENLGPAVERLADMEGLDAHRRAVSLRRESNQS